MTQSSVVKIFLRAARARYQRKQVTQSSVVKIFRRSFFAEVFRKTFFGSSFALETGRGHHVSRIKFKWAEARTKAKCVRTNIYDQFHYFGKKKRRFGVNAGVYIFLTIKLPSMTVCLLDPHACCVEVASNSGLGGALPTPPQNQKSRE